MKVVETLYATFVEIVKIEKVSGFDKVRAVWRDVVIGGELKEGLYYCPFSKIIRDLKPSPGERFFIGCARPSYQNNFSFPVEFTNTFTKIKYIYDSRYQRLFSEEKIPLQSREYKKPYFNITDYEKPTEIKHFIGKYVYKTSISKRSGKYYVFELTKAKINQALLKNNINKVYLPDRNNLIRNLLIIQDDIVEFKTNDFINKPTVIINSGDIAIARFPLWAKNHTQGNGIEYDEKTFKYSHF
jgi:hypothetical protein